MTKKNIVRMFQAAVVAQNAAEAAYNDRFTKLAGHPAVRLLTPFRATIEEGIRNGLSNLQIAVAIDNQPCAPKAFKALSDGSAQQYVSVMRSYYAMPNRKTLAIMSHLANTF